jgi:hypothetical protein
MLDAQVASLRTLFSPPDWTAVDELTTASTITFRAVDMIILIADGNKVDWSELQSELHYWCSKQDDVADLDPYLFIVVDTFDDATTADLRAAVDDRFVCRKIAIILEGRPWDVALRDYWLFRSFSTVSEQSYGIDTAPPLKGLVDLSALLDSPDIVAERLLEQIRIGGTQ